VGAREYGQQHTRTRTPALLSPATAAAFKVVLFISDESSRQRSSRAATAAIFQSNKFKKLRPNLFQHDAAEVGLNTTHEMMTSHELQAAPVLKSSIWIKGGRTDRLSKVG
jgi:hypothetical protein